ncbi:MAG: YlbF family regulator [Clostridia bacterium]|nr:YlbF family regulator [Clostridia bacterium]
MNEIIKKTEELAKLLEQSIEYRAYTEAREAAFKSESTGALLREYRRLQAKLQAAELSGGADADELAKLQKLGELLQLDDAAGEYLFAQFRLNALIGDIYKRLAKAVDADLSFIDD